MTTNTVCIIPDAPETVAPTTKKTTTTNSTTTTSTTTTKTTTTRKPKLKKCPFKPTKSALRKSIMIEVNEKMNFNLHDLIMEKVENADLGKIDVAVNPSKLNYQESVLGTS